MNETDNKPQCIAFIMDGNRRWAKGKGLETIEGHRKGADVFNETVEWGGNLRIPHLFFYAFSSENWNRTEKEVTALMTLFSEKLSELRDRLSKGDKGVQVRFRFVGDLGAFGEAFLKGMKDVEEASSQFTGTTVWVGLSYGGRNEIVRAVNKAVENGGKVTEESFRTFLWSGELPDPDIIVRTGGAQRLSNILPWHSVYSELVFLEKLWPEITTEDLEGVLHEYRERNRNFGK